MDISCLQIDFLIYKNVSFYDCITLRHTCVAYETSFTQ